MEVVVGVLLVIAVPIVLLGAKRGAEAAQRERETRWSRLPAGPSAAGSGAATGGYEELSPRAPALRRQRAPGSTAVLEATPSTFSETPSAPPDASPPALPDATPSASARTAGTPAIDLNHASVDELRNLPGVGVRAAQRIVDHRAVHGPFATIGDLERVEGFDHHRVSRLTPRATV